MIVLCIRFPTVGMLEPVSCADSPVKKCTASRQFTSIEEGGADVSCILHPHLSSAREVGDSHVLLSMALPVLPVKDIYVARAFRLGRMVLPFTATGGVCVGVDVDNQYITISALWTLPTPVPWDATCE
jgi:hypothetical protein